MSTVDLRGVATLLVMIAFIGVCIWAYSSKRKARFDEAALLPFSDDEPPQEDTGKEKQDHE